MLKDQLKERAKTYIQLPEHFQPVIEEWAEGEDGDGEAIFLWADEKQEEGISVTLDLSGNLTGLSIDLLNAAGQEPINECELSQRAEEFLRSHYPLALEALIPGRAKRLTRACRFYFEQIVMELPLPRAGCIIDVDFSGEVVHFQYNGLKPEPAVPNQLIAQEKLIEDVRKRLDFQLKAVDVNSAFQEIDEDGLRLVYEIEPGFMNYKADVLDPELSIIHEEDEDEPEMYMPLPPFQTAMEEALTNEEVIGITNEMEVIREVECGAETGVVWRNRNWKMNDHDLSIDQFFQQHNEDTVKAFIANETGKINGFMWFKERTGELHLSREECYQKAIEFLHMAIPAYIPFLQVLVRAEDEEMEEESLKEKFIFRMHNGYGIPLSLENVMVAVNRTTREVDYYSGPRFKYEQFKRLPIEAAISKKQAQDIFLSRLDFKLAWHENVEEQGPAYILVYEACEKESGKSMRYVDAMTGVIITDKE